MPKLKIDGSEIEVPKGTKVIEAAERLGIVIPRFCYHPALGSAGACRMCAVMFADGPIKGIQMSCMVVAQDGMVVSTHHPEAVSFRKQVIEWLMVNHPHDCPVCDEGGQCLLQDMTVSGSHGIRRYEGEKRTYRDQYLGVFLQHEMNRCIHCYRCSRFYQEFGGYRDLGAMQIARRTYFGRYQDGPLESPFAGNLADICPTGVYTDKTARFKGRRWDFERGPSLCIHCSLGCHTVGSARYREAVLMEAGFSEAVNGYFICDRGRFGFHYSAHPERPREARISGEKAPYAEAFQRAVEGLGAVSRKNGPEAIALLSSHRSSLENLGMLKRLSIKQGWRMPGFAETRAMADKVKEAVLRLDAGLAISLREIEGADFILVAGVDPVNEAPMLALTIRQAVRRGCFVAVIDPRPIFLPCAFAHIPAAPGEMGIYMGVLLKKSVERSRLEGLGEKAIRFFDALPEEYPGDALRDGLSGIENKLKQSKKPVIVCGTDIVPDFLPALAADQAMILKTAKERTGLFYVLPGANAFGAGLLFPEGGSCEQIVEAMEEGKVKALVVMESDPFRFFPDRKRLTQALEKLDLLVALDYVPTKIAAMASAFLPTAPLFETESTFVNQEGRAQFAEPFYRSGSPIGQVSGGGHPPRVFQKEIPGGEIKPGWMILAELGNALASPAQDSIKVFLKDHWEWMIQNHPVLSGVPPFAAPDGIRLTLKKDDQKFFSSPAGEGRKISGRDGLEILCVDWTLGTEELSSYSPFIQRAESPPCIYIQMGDASGLRLRDKDRVSLSLDGGVLEIEIKVVENMASGFLILPRHRNLPWQILKTPPGKITMDKITKA